MAGRKKAAEVPRALVPRHQLEKELDEQIDVGRGLLPLSIKSMAELDLVRNRAYTWTDYCKELLRRRFSSDDLAEELDFVVPGIFQAHATLATRVDDLHDYIKQSIRRLESIRQRLPLIADADGAIPMSLEGPHIEGWIYPRLFDHLGPDIRRARASAKPEDWGRVTREATLFLENELRQRTGIQTHKRQDLAAAAFKPGGPLSWKSDEGWQKAWMHFVMGILGAFGNPGAHMIRKHTETFAMGVVGAVSTVLVALDGEIGPPPSE